MRCCTMVAICLVSTFSPMLSSAQVGTTNATPGAHPTGLVIPNTVAGRVLRTWLDAFNSSDTARMAAYYRQYQPDQDGDAEAAFRRMTGGFDLLTIERSEPYHIEFTVKERNSAMKGYGMFDVSKSQPPHVTAAPILAMGTGGSVATLHIDAATRARVIAGAVAALDTFYVFPPVANAMGDSLHARLARGAYGSYDNGIAFAVEINKELSDIAHDKHLSFNYSIRPLPAEPSGPEAPPSPEDSARQRRQLASRNCGFVKAEQLDGNVGYLKFDMFADPDICGPTASAAMSFLANTRALIIDLRDNGGGSPKMVAYIASYLFTARTHLNDLWNRKSGETEEYWTLDSIPGRRYGADKPVYILTSKRTFSGAEEFTYDLKNLKRATIVGETTGGGAHTVSGHRLDEHFMIGVPNARAINPVTHTDWEGVGVEPDVKVPAKDALATAEKLVAEKVKQ
jgi:retinol-binding protein 3